MQFLRLRLRSLLILIALAGICFGVAALWWRSTEYSRKAWISENDLEIGREYLEMAAEAIDEESSKEFLTMHSLPMGKGPAADQVAILVRFVRRRNEHYASLVAKYRRAARYPWHPVAPDPPLPEIPPEIVVR